VASCRAQQEHMAAQRAGASPKWRHSRARLQVGDEAYWSMPRRQGSQLVSMVTTVACRVPGRRAEFAINSGVHGGIHGGTGAIGNEACMRHRPDGVWQYCTAVHWQYRTTSSVHQAHLPQVVTQAPVQPAVRRQTIAPSPAGLLVIVFY
jgi:hypothetical protein